MPDLTCTFTGHRASKLPWGYREDDPRCRELKRRIYDAAEAVCSAGVRRYICGMAEGCDLYFCEAVLALREERPGLHLEAAIPFPGQADRWPDAQRSRYRKLLSQCDSLTVLCPEYTRDCMMERNRYMIDHAHILIACYDGRSGGTLNTLQYAGERRLQVIQIPIPGLPEEADLPDPAHWTEPAF